MVATWFHRRLNLLLAGLAVTAIVFLVVAVLPPLLVGGEDSENEVRATLLQALGGLVLLAGLYLTYRTFDLNRQGQVTERFTRAIDQLGEDRKLDVRLGGIYALERIAWDSQRDHWPVMEVLTAYVREHSSSGRSPPERGRRGGPSPPAQGEAVDRNKVPADVQAILTVLGRRNTEYDWPEGNLDLGRANLQRADLGGANLEKVFLEWADLQRAFLAYANFQWANLPATNLQSADLAEANLQFANLVNADLRGANLAGANLRRANLSGANLRGANLAGAKLVGVRIDSRTEADVDLVSLGAKLSSK
jgi:hypothetical protein